VKHDCFVSSVDELNFPPGMGPREGKGNRDRRFFWRVMRAGLQFACSCSWTEQTTPPHSERKDVGVDLDVEVMWKWTDLSEHARRWNLGRSR